MDHARTLATQFAREALGEGAAAVVQVPVEALGQQQVLPGLEPQRVQVVDLRQHRRDAHVAWACQAELRRLLDAVHRIRPGIRQAQHLGA